MSRSPTSPGVRRPLVPGGVRESSLAVGRMIGNLFLVLGAIVAAIGLALIWLTPWVLVGGAGWIAVALGLRAIFWAMEVRRLRREALRQTGAPGTATVLEAIRTGKRFHSAGTPGGGQRVWQMRLQIEAEGIPQYEIEKEMVTEVGPSGREPGRKWPVFVDREDHSKILVDWETLQASGHTVEVRPGLVISSQDPIERDT
jgi:hypothetical protein